MTVMQNGKQEAAQARRARLAEELRQNLKRRKSQTRKRKVTPDAGEPDSGKAEITAKRNASDTE